MSPFDCLSPERIAGLIYGAKNIVVFSSSSLTAKIGKALVETAKRIGFERVIVLLDTSEDVLRMGYGEVEGVKMLLEQPDMIFREADGLRINTLICDEAGWVFSLPPMAIESQQVPEGGFNAIFLSYQQRQQILRAINPTHNNPELDPEVVGCDPTDEIPSIGASDVYEEGLKEVVAKVEKSPPRPFDLTRLVNVYQAKIEFVELGLKGARINQHRIQLPKQLKALLANDPEAQRRINASYQIVDSESEVSGAELNEKIKVIRENYLSNLKGVGTVLLKEHRKSFQQELKDLETAIANFRENLQGKVKGDISKNIQSLSAVFAKLMVEQQPQHFVHKISGKLTFEIAKKIVEDLLWKTTPSVEKLAGNIQLRCLYKDVTIEMLRNEDFQKQVGKAFNHVDWKLPFDESLAAPEQLTFELPEESGC